MNQSKKHFDCIKMKRDIQERMHQDTQSMTPDEYKAYIRERIRSSQFASFLDAPASPMKSQR